MRLQRSTHIIFEVLSRIEVILSGIRYRLMEKKSNVFTKTEQMYTPSIVVMV